MNTQNFKNKILFIALLVISLGGINNVNARTVDFSGYTWNVKETASGTTMGPGANNWGSTIVDDQNDVRVDSDGKLHLFVSQRPNSSWYSSEVYLATSSLGYGKYTFDIDSRLDLLDKNLIAAPFLYQDDTHEIDIEHSYWSNTTTATNLYYTVQPFDKAGNQQTQHLDLSDTTFQDIIYWEPNKITLSTEQNGTPISTWTYTSSTNGTTDNFSPGNERVHINFWQYQSLSPLNVSSTHEFIIKNFTFVPYQIPTSTPTSTPIIIDTSTPSNTTSTTSTNQNGSGGSSNNSTNTPVPVAKIDDTVTKLIAFLQSKQEADGKISDTSTADWVTMSFGAKNIYASDVKNGDKSLYEFIYNTKIADIEQENNKCAGYSRHILALLSSGVSKTDPKIIELKNKLDTACVQNNIFGLSGINDDIFGLMAALALDEEQISIVVTTTLASIKADQQIDGSFTWDGWAGADMTGAAINALKYAQNKGSVIDQNIFTKAKQYLKSQQHIDGGWGCYDYNNGCLESDALTTGWAVMGINSLSETQNDWFNSAGKNPWHILTTLDNDYFAPSWGGIDWFATKHAVPALLGKTWPIILDPKPVVNNQTGGGASSFQPTVSTTLTTTTTTSTLLATTTITIATSTTSTLPIVTTTTPITEVATSTTSNIIIEKTEKKPTITLSRNSEVKKPFLTTITNNIEQTTTTKPQLELSAGKPQTDQNKTVDNLPLDTPTKRNAKKILAISGGSALVVGAYIGLRLLKNVI